MFRRMRDWFAEWQYPEQAEAARKARVRPPRLNICSNAHGRHTAFDEIVRFVGVRRQVGSVREFRWVEHDQARISFEANIVQRCEPVEMIFPLSAIGGISQSRENLQRFDNIQAFGEDCLKWNASLIESGEALGASQNLLDEALESGGADFDLKLWSPTIRFVNSGGSHRLAAVAAMAQRMGHDFMVRGSLTIYRINIDWLDQVSERFNVFFTDPGDRAGSWQLIKMLRDYPQRTDHLVVDLPHPSQGIPYHIGRRGVTAILVKRGAKIPRPARLWLAQHAACGDVVPWAEFRRVIQDAERDGNRFLERYVKPLDEDLMKF